MYRLSSVGFVLLVFLYTLQVTETLDLNTPGCQVIYYAEPKCHPSPRKFQNLGFRQKLQYFARGKEGTFSLCSTSTSSLLDVSFALRGQRLVGPLHSKRALGILLQQTAEVLGYKQWDDFT